MVVEGQQMDAAGFDIGQGGVQGIEVVRLPPQMDAHVAGPGAGGQCRQQGAPGGQAAQPRFPRQRHPVEGGGDAVGQQLGFGVPQGQVGWEVDAGTGLQLAFERVAVQVDDAGQDQQAGGVEARAGGRRHRSRSSRR